MDLIKRFEIKNPSGQKIVGEFGSTDYSKKQPAIIICSGHGGIMRQPQINYLAEGLAKNGYTTVSFDQTDANGESDGRIINGTVGSYLKNLHTVINYIDKKPFINSNQISLFGTSVGGMIGYLVAAEDNRIKSLVLHEPVYHFKQSQEERHNMNKWKTDGYRTYKSGTTGLVYKIGWNYYVEGITHDDIGAVKRLRCPTLIITGTKDKIMRKYSEELLNNLQTKKNIIILEDAPHTLRKEEHMQEELNHIVSWLDETL
ncbi:MAG: alpha/beta fold hydrolase [Patescibacteria group bacterium]